MSIDDYKHADRWVCATCERPLDVDAVRGTVEPCDACLTDALDIAWEGRPYMRGRPARKVEPRPAAPQISELEARAIVEAGPGFEDCADWVRKVRAEWERFKENGGL